MTHAANQEQKKIKSRSTNRNQSPSQLWTCYGLSAKSVSRDYCAVNECSNIFVASGKKKKKKRKIGISSLTAVEYPESAQIRSGLALPLKIQRLVWLNLKGFSILHVLFPQSSVRRLNREWNSKWWTPWVRLNSLQCFLECVQMQLPPTLLCCTSSHLSETLFGHSEPGKSHCLLIGEKKTKKNRKSKTNTRKSVRRLFWVFLTALVLLSSFGWSPRWDEEGLCSDKGKRNTDYTIGVTYLCYRKRAWGSRKDRTWWQKNHFSYLVPLENTGCPISFQSGMGMLFFQYTQKVISRHLSAIGFWRKEKQ